MSPLAGKHVVVIGGASGVGAAIASAARDAGAKVTVGSSRSGLDLAAPDSIRRFFAGLAHIDHLVSTAHSPRGVATITPLATLDFAALHQAFAVKFFGVLEAVRQAVPRMARDGSILLTSGAASQRVIPGHVGLGALNAAVEGAVLQLAKELAPIRVNALCPGLVRTDAYDSLPAAEREAMFAARAKALPVGRVGTPADIAQAALHFLTNGYLTACTAPIDGGARLG
ncbi:MAG: SDR family oxidoreductase [Alphaproteobacteria bacterium]|nr:SDR family oxidoreductase [Alphaproteobacteria bacterium]